MDNKMETAMDNELDFRVGDVVCDIRYGTGTIHTTLENGFNVAFGKDAWCSYCDDGREIDGEMHRALYHGTWEQVFGNLPDLKPKRKVKRWVNLYYRENQIIAGHAYPRPEEARAVCDASLVAKAIEVEVDE